MQKKPLIYNPAQKPRHQLIEEFVIRNQVFDKLFKQIKEANREMPPQHYLIAGQRGMGKTTLLLRLKYAIEDDPELNHFLIPVRFSEEQYNITRLEDLWEETASILEGQNATFKGLDEEMKVHEREKDYERVCLELLEKKLKKNKQRVLLMIDNIGDLLEKFKELEAHRLREVLMTSPYIQLLGASTRVLEYTFSYDKPFFEFFEEMKLEPLSTESAVALLKALGKEYKKEEIIEEIIEKSPQRIEVFRRITGGVPRTMVLLFTIFTENRDGTVLVDLTHLLDEVNSLYKHRMDELKPQQQLIVDSLARAYEAITAKEILERTKLYREDKETNLISSQLKQLTENQIVESITIGKRKVYYRIRERFFNIWYLMRHGKKQNKEYIIWLIKFLEDWCTHKELESMALDQMDCMKNGEYAEGVLVMNATAFMCIDKIQRGKRILYGEMSQAYLTIKGLHEEADEMQKEVDELKWKEIEEEVSRENYEKAEELVKKFSGEDKGHWLGKLSSLYYYKQDYSKAEYHSLQAIKEGNDLSMFNLGLLYHTIKKDYDKAEYYYLQAIKKGNISAMNNLGLFYQRIRLDYDKAEALYLQAFGKGHTGAMNNLGLFYKDVKRDYDKAESFYLKAIEKGSIEAMFNLAIVYQYIRNDSNKAESLFLKAIERGDSNSMYNLGILYEDEKGDFDKAEYYYLQAIQNGFGDLKIHHAITFLLNRNKVKEVLPAIEKLLHKEEYYEKVSWRYHDLLKAIFKQKQYHFLLNLFEEENSLLMKFASPYYHVLGYFLKEEMPGVYERTNPEIQETVDEIIQSIQQE